MRRMCPTYSHPKTAILDMTLANSGNDKSLNHRTQSEVEEIFLFEECSSLRREIENHLQDIKRLDSQVLAGIFAIYVWILTRGDAILVDFIRIALYLPPILCVLGFLKWVAIMKKMLSVADYIKIVEKKMLEDTDVFGWEHYIERRRKDRPIVGQMEGGGKEYFLAYCICHHDFYLLFCSR